MMLPALTVGDTILNAAGMRCYRLVSIKSFSVMGVVNGCGESVRFWLRECEVFNGLFLLRVPRLLRQ